MGEENIKLLETKSSSSTKKGVGRGGGYGALNGNEEK